MNFSISKILVVSFGFFLFQIISSSPGVCSHSENATKHVLLLNSYHQGMTWVDQVTSAVIEELDPENNNIVFHVENMDTKRNPSVQYLHSLYNLYKLKFSNVEFDLILASDNNAFDFLVKYRNEMFSGTPIVFCGVNHFSSELLAGVSDFTGVAEVFDAAKTVQIALKNHPKTEEVYIVNDYLKTGRAYEKDIRQQLTPFAADLKLRYSENLALTELEEEIASLGPNAIVLLGGYFSDRDGLYVTYEQIGQLLASYSSVPVYCLLSFNVGKGVVGGNVVDGFSQGKAMAHIGQRILKGENPSAIPVVKGGVNSDKFNYDEITRFEIDVNKLPANSIFINKPSPVYLVGKGTFWSTVFVVCVILALYIWFCYLLLKNQRIKKKLKESEAYNRTIFEESPIGLVFCRMGGELLDVNPAYAAIIGYSVEETLQLSYVDLTPDDYAAQEEEKIRLLKTEGRHGPYEKEYIAKDGRRVPVRLSGVLQENNNEQFILASVEDITEEKLEQLRAVRMSHLASLGELAAGVAHEINNPLNGVINYTQMYLNKFDPPGEGRDLLKRVIKEGSRVADIVTNLLHYSRQDNGVMGEVHILDVISEALTLFNAQLMKEGIILSLEVDENMPLVMGRFTDLERLIINLVSNSRYALNQKYPAISNPEKILKISVRKGQDDDWPHIRLCVEDKGVGIPKEQMPKVFNPFMTTKPAGDGTGLGLNICHQIVQQHKGTIDIESEVDHYTRVFIDLPIAGAE
jgi:PAS domain S-box-containing protein